MTGIHGIKLTYGRDVALQRLVHINDVARGSGKECRLNCANCGAGLIARQGNVRRWHFAHINERDCAGAVETALHIRAKEIIAEAGSLLVPSISVRALEQICRRSDHPIDEESLTGSSFWRSNQELLAPRRVTITSATVEQPFEFEGRRFVADVMMHGDQDIAVEIHVAHAVEEEKARAFQKAGITAIEIQIGMPTDALSDDAGFKDYVLLRASRSFLSLSSADLQSALAKVPTADTAPSEARVRPLAFRPPEENDEPVAALKPEPRAWRKIDDSKLKALQRDFVNWQEKAIRGRPLLESTIEDLRRKLLCASPDSADADNLRRKITAAEEDLRRIDSLVGGARRLI